MKLSRDQITGFVISVILLVSLFIWVSVNRKQLLKDRDMSVARITDCSYGGRGHVGTITLTFIFHKDNNEIEGSSALSSNEINVQDVKSFLLNRTFPVIYSPHNPKNNYILIRPEDFKKFNYSFPDSLKWVLKYFHR